MIDSTLMINIHHYVTAMTCQTYATIRRSGPKCKGNPPKNGIKHKLQCDPQDRTLKECRDMPSQMKHYADKSDQ